MLDYKLIEALAMVVQEGGFERAAKALHLTQSAVSQRVKLLEDRLGRVLLTRTTPPKPTGPGRELIKHYRQVLSLELGLTHGLNPDQDPDQGEVYGTLRVGVNADSLDTWFLEAVTPYLRQERMVLDILVEDQDETHRLLKDGEVVGCVSARAEPMQGCRVERLGSMEYRLMGAPDFAKQWFARGFTAEAAEKAPVVIFNHKDATQDKIFRLLLGKPPRKAPMFYMPSSDKFVELVALGLAYGMIPWPQAEPLAGQGRLVDLHPEGSVTIELFWHCWNLESVPLKRFSEMLTKGAAGLLTP